MPTYEVLTLMIAFGVLIVATLDNKNDSLISFRVRE
ncbi:putative holin-like toxin [Listeria innocua]